MTANKSTLSLIVDLSKSAAMRGMPHGWHGWAMLPLRAMLAYLFPSTTINFFKWILVNEQICFVRFMPHIPFTKNHLFTNRTKQRVLIML